MIKRLSIFVVLASIAVIVYLPNVLFSAPSLAQPEPSPVASATESAAPTEIARVDAALPAPASIYFAPEQIVELQLPESLRALSEITLLAGFDATDGGKVDHLTTSFDLLSESTLGIGVRLTIDSQGNLYTGYQDQSRLRVISSLCRRDTDPTLPPAVDYFIADAGGVVNPEGIEVIDALGVTLVADSNPDLPMIALFGKLATGETVLGLRITKLGGQRPTDLSYDFDHDRLYVATMNGVILGFGDFSRDYGADGPDQVLVPFDPSTNQQVSRNFQSIAYVPAADTLIASDIGMPGDADDGQILVLDQASQSSGGVPMRLQITGAETRLRDPVDLAFDGSRLYVAEGASGALLRFDDILSGTGTLALPPAADLPAPNIHSLALLPPFAPENSDCTLMKLTELTEQQTNEAIARDTELPTQVPSVLPTSDSNVNATPVPIGADSSTGFTAAQAAPDVGSVQPTSVPPTLVPRTPIPPTPIPPTPIPPTPIPPTPVPPTPIPPTEVPPTPIPPTPIPPTDVPPTDIPPTPDPPTAVPPTPEPTRDGGNSGHGSSDDHREDNGGHGGGG